MKYLKTVSMLFILFTALMPFACKNTPAEQAKEANEEKFYGDFRLEEDAEFLVDYAAFLNLSTEMADLATRKAQSVDVQLAANNILEDHRMLERELNNLADHYRIELPEKLSEQQQSQLDLLASEGIDDIDDLYLSQVIRLHEEWEPKLKEVIGHTQVDTILNFARKINSHQFRHLERARNLTEIDPAS